MLVGRSLRASTSPCFVTGRAPMARFQWTIRGPRKKLNIVFISIRGQLGSSLAWLARTRARNARRLLRWSWPAMTSDAAWLNPQTNARDLPVDTLDSSSRAFLTQVGTRPPADVDHAHADRFKPSRWFFLSPTVAPAAPAFCGVRTPGTAP